MNRQSKFKFHALRINPKHYHQHPHFPDPIRAIPSPKPHMASRTENRPPRSLSNVSSVILVLFLFLIFFLCTVEERRKKSHRFFFQKKGGTEEAFSDKRRRIGTERMERQGGRGRAPLGALKADANEAASVESSECSAVEFTKEEVEALLNEKTNTKENRYDNKVSGWLT